MNVAIGRCDQSRRLQSFVTRRTPLEARQTPLPSPNPCKTTTGVSFHNGMVVFTREDPSKHGWNFGRKTLSYLQYFP